MTSQWSWMPVTGVILIYVVDLQQNQDFINPSKINQLFNLNFNKKLTK
jgi:hypothetical protein